MHIWCWRDRGGQNVSIRRSTSRAKATRTREAGSASESLLLCSFRGKSQRQARKMIAGPGVYICDECVDLCVEVLEEGDGGMREAPARAEEIDLSKLGLKPRFQTVIFSVIKDHCFHLCPFAEPFNTIYKDHVCRSAAVAGFTIQRADAIYGTDPVIDDIWMAINSSAVVVADVTGRNPNVMYEIGMAHTVGRPVIIMTQSMEDVPFDLKHYRCITYEYTPHGCAMLEEKLSSTLQFLKSKKAG
jgi:hypothetical protein